MVSSDMEEDGHPLLDLDDSFFGPDPGGISFSWGDEFLDDAIESELILGSNSNDLAPAAPSSSQLLPSVSSTTPQQVVSVVSSVQGGQIIQAANGLQPGQAQAQLAGAITTNQGLSTQVAGAGQFILKPGGQIQLQAYPQVQGHQQLQTIQTVQQLQRASPLVTHTHGQSPVPSASPLMSQSPSSGVLTNVTMTTASSTPTHMNRMSPAPNVNLVHFPNTLQNQSQVQIAGHTVPIQNLLQMQGTNINSTGAGGLFQGQIIQGANANSSGGYVQGQLMQGQGLGATILQGQGTILQAQGGTLLQNQSRPAAVIPGQVSGGAMMQGQGQSTLVNTQNTVIQNPNVVNVNVAHVIHSTQPGGSQQGGAVSGLQTVQGSIPGTIIQTPDGKNILIPNQQWGQQLNLQNLQQLNLNLGQQSSSGSTLVQGTSNAGGNIMQGNVIRLATQPGSQDKSVTQGVPQYFNLAQQGSQIFIQRTPTPGQPQNIILRTLPQQNLIQMQQPVSSAQSSQIQSVSQTSHPGFVTSHQQPATFLSSAHQQGVPLQVSASQTQQVKLVNQSGLATGSPATNLPVTVNLPGQNVNLQQLQFGQLQGGIQFIQQPQQSQQQSQPQQATFKISGHSVAVTGIGQTNSIMSRPQNITPGAVINTQQFNQNSGVNQSVCNVSASHVQQQPLQSISQSHVTGQQPELQLQGTPQQLTQTVQNLSIPFSQFPGAVTSTTGFSTAQFIPVSTVTQSSGQLASSVYSVAATTPAVSSSQAMSGATTPQARIAKPTTAQHVAEARTSAPRLQAIQLTFDAQNKIQQIQNEIKQLSAQKNLNAAQSKRLQQLTLLQKKIIAQGQRQYVQAHLQQQQQQQQQATPGGSQTSGQSTLAHVPSQQVFGQPAVALPQVTGTVVVSAQGTLQMATAPAQGNLTSGQTAVTIVSSQSPNNAVPSLPKLLMSTAKSQSMGDKSSPGVSVSSDASQVQQSVQNPAIQSPLSIAKLPLPSATALQRAPPGKLPIPASSQVAVPTQIKIGNQLLTLNLTVAQKEKVLAHLAKMSPEDQQLYLRQQQPVLIKIQQQQQLQAQIQAQVHNQVKQQQQQQQQTAPTQTMVMVATPSKIPLTVQQLDKKGASQMPENQSAASPNKGIKRSTPVAEIPKGSLIHQQLSKDQMRALKPDMKTPFENKREACRRLVRYHTFQYTGPTRASIQRADNLFENISKELLRKKATMFEKYQLLLLEESMRESPSAEIVMIQKMVNQDLSTLVEDEKKVIKEDPDSFEPMPQKYLKVEVADSKQKPMSLDTVPVKSENVDGEHVKQEMEEDLEDHKNKYKLKTTVKTEPGDICDSPCSTSGKMKLVIRNDGLNFTSSLAVDKSSSSEECEESELPEAGDLTTLNSSSSIAEEEGMSTSHDSGLVPEYSITNVKQEPLETEEDFGDVSEDFKPFQNYAVQDDYAQSDMSIDIEGTDEGCMKTDTRGLDTANYSDISDVSVDEIVSSSLGNATYAGDRTQSVTDPYSESQAAVKALETNSLTNSHSFGLNFSEQNHNSSASDFSRLSSVDVSFPHYPSVSANHFDSAQSDKSGIESTHYFHTDSGYYDNRVTPSTHDNFSPAAVKEDETAAGSCSPSKEVESAISSIVGLPDNGFDSRYIDSANHATGSDYVGRTEHPAAVDYMSHDTLPTQARDKSYFSQGSNVVQNSDQQPKESENLSDAMEWDDTSSEPDNQNNPMFKAQMESAINSILGFSQESSSPVRNYDLDQTAAFDDSNVNYRMSQSESSCDGMGELDGREQNGEGEVIPESPGSPVIDDLDAAVNSILF